MENTNVEIVEVIKIAKPGCEHEQGTHCLHSSERKAYRSCKLRWDYSSRQHLKPFGQAKPLEFGIAIHKAMEVFFNPELWGKLTNLEKLERAVIVFDETNEEQRDKFLKSGVQGIDDYEDRKILGAGMLRYYAEEIHPFQDNWIEPVRTEVPFQIPLYVPEHPKFRRLGIVGDPVLCHNSPACGQIHENPAPVTLNGRLDALFKDLQNGGYYIFDWKTKGQALTTNDKFLYLDTQMTDYVAALILELNINIKGICYAEMRKDIPKAPPQNQRRRKGCLFSVSKNNSTTFEIAERTFKIYDTEAYEEGLYDDYLKYLKSDEAPSFHKRFFIRQSPAKMRKALAYASMEAMEMVDPDLIIYPSTGKFNCENCAFIEPCQMRFLGEDEEFILNSDFKREEYDADRNGVN